MGVANVALTFQTGRGIEWEGGVSQQTGRKAQTGERGTKTEVERNFSQISSVKAALALLSPPAYIWAPTPPQHFIVTDPESTGSLTVPVCYRKHRILSLP